MIEKYQWEKFDNPKLSLLKKEYNLEKVVKKGKDEFEKQLLLKSWIYKTLPRGNPKRDYSELSAFEILNDGKKGKEMYCTQFAFTFMQCAASLGWYSRKLAVDFNHNLKDEGRHHGITDIWSDKFKKWYVVDSLHNLHFEKDNIPLNSLEIRIEYLKDKAKDVEGIIGNYQKIITYNSNQEGFDTPSNYFWFFISLRNNFFENPGIYNTKALLWVDNYNKDKIWYMFKEDKSIKHPMYKSQFIETNNKAFCFPVMNK